MTGLRFISVNTRLPFFEARRRVLEPFERAYAVALRERHSKISDASRASGLSKDQVLGLYDRHGLGAWVGISG